MRDGVKSVEMATQIRPDVIVLSMGIPGMNGYDVCQTLAADPALARIPQPDRGLLRRAGLRVPDTLRHTG